MIRAVILSPWRVVVDDGPASTLRERQTVAMHRRRSLRAYLGRCLRDSVLRGETPYASHVMPALMALDDDQPAERAMGLACERPWLDVADRVAVYLDFGLSDGMLASMHRAREVGVEVVERRLR